MKSFHEMPKYQRVLSGLCVLALVLVYALVEDSTFIEEGEEYVADVADFSEGPPVPPTERSRMQGGRPSGDFGSQQVESGTQRVVLHDRGLQLAVGAMYIPSEWRLEHDIARDPQSGTAVRYRLNTYGDNGEILRSMEPTTYAANQGQHFQQVLQQRVAQLIGADLTEVQFGNLQPSSVLQQSRLFQQALQSARAQGSAVDGLELPLRGMRNGQAYRGAVYVSHYYSPQLPGFGMVSASSVIAPERQFAAAVETNVRMVNTFQENPAYAQRMQQISAQQHQQRMAHNQAQFQAHQQRMANRQAQFDAHQQRMRDASAASDARHQAWMRDFRGGSASSGGSSYTGHDAFIDTLHERNTFDDPWSGQQRHVDTQHKYNYTNGLGDFYGTDDPSFNKHSLQGNWEEIEPLQMNE